MKAKLLKRMTYEGKTLNAGEIIDVKDWRNLKTLISNRYIEVLLEEAVTEEIKKPKSNQRKDLVTK